ncbi:carboxypeptidase B-like [Pieris napi]|uniref:carboxypeptidase B-like n=1 Tax=Pieris napi TaxID=78633 RepID=UPI001FB9DB10|nr:carboxypeptidase B-like [Pieris napi]
MNVSWPKVAPQIRAKHVSKRVTQMMLQEEPEISTRYIPLDDEDGSEFLSPYAIKQQLSRISSKFPNTNITTEVIGRTVEYNDLVLMKISEMNDLQRHFRAEDDKYADEAPQKKIVFIVHGLSVMGISSIDCLSHDKGFTKLLSYYLTHLDNFDIFLIPLANPDGFTASQHKTIWNKNVSPQNACPGVNIDRNFDVAWNSSNIISSCSQQYPGTSPFSEAESRAIRDVFHKYGHKIVAYMHVHAGSYAPSIYKGEAVLYPRGFSEAQLDDDKYIDLKGDIDEAMRNASFKAVSVTVDTLHNWYGRVFGSSVDYASTIYGIPFSLELVMQLYDKHIFDTVELYEESALSQVWSRVIDVIFTHIWRHIHETDT